MKTPLSLLISTLLIWAPALHANEDSDLREGEKLYLSQCRVCHGNVALARNEGTSRESWLRLARQESSGIKTDYPSGILGSDLGVRRSEKPPQLAIAPPYGPILKGVYGRVAATIAGFDYSPAFRAAFTGMEWNEAALDVWITDTQRWVPGVYMFYKQKDPEVRRKIIAYLKANP
jgi:cytochrome c2